jgi:DNA-binding response OmpR family regulator
MPDDTSSMASFPIRHPISRPAPRATALVADHDDRLRTLVVETLRSDGYHVIEARDGAEVLALLFDTLEDPGLLPDLLVMDAPMPKLSGLGVLEEMRRARVALPVFITTGFAHESVGIVARRLGAMAVLTRPFDVDDLRAAVSKAEQWGHPRGIVSIPGFATRRPRASGEP